MNNVSVQDLGDLGGKALTEFIKELPAEDVVILSQMPAGLVAKIFQAGCVFGVDQAIKISEPKGD